MRDKGRAKLKTRRVKEVISSQKRTNLLYKVKNNQPLIPLDKPVRHGWERYFVIRPDLVHSKYYKVLTAILGMINNTVHSRNKEFTYTHFKTRKQMPIEQYVHHLPDKKGAELEPQFQRWFVRTKFIYPYSKEVYYNWVFTHPQFFVFRTRPFYLTHKQLVDSEVESELAFLNKWIYDGRRYRLLDSFCRNRWRDWDCIQPVKELKMKITTKEQLDEIE